MLELVGVGAITALGFFIVMWKINLQFFCIYHWQTDLIVSGIMCYLFFGTFSGMAVAVTAGVFLSLFLYLAKRSLGV